VVDSIPQTYSCWIAGGLVIPFDNGAERKIPQIGSEERPCEGEILVNQLEIRFSTMVILDLYDRDRATLRLNE